MTRNAIRDLFGRHKSRADLAELVHQLLGTGDYDEITEETGGRPVTLLIYRPSAKSAESD
jgi:hypothetical protein